MRVLKNAIVFLFIMGTLVAVMAENKTAEVKEKEQEEVADDQKDMSPHEKKLLACTMLQIVKYETDKKEHKLFKDIPKNASKEKARKLKSMMLMKCEKEITDEKVDKVLNHEIIA